MKNRPIVLVMSLSMSLVLLTFSVGFTADPAIRRSGSDPVRSAGEKPDSSTIMQSSADAAAYSIPWQSINAGGASGTSTNYQLNGSVGQSAIGFVTSTNYQHGIGYWYGISGCDCGVWGDVNADGAINPTDVVIMVNHVYKGIDNRVQPPNCPEDAGDVNCDDAVNPADVVSYVNYVYKGMPWLCPDPCE